NPPTNVNGLIMVPSSEGAAPRDASGGTTPITPGDVDAERYAAVPRDETVPLDEVARAIKDIADGRPVVVVDDADRENEGDIVFAASKATPELLAFTIRYGRGLICVPMLGE